MEEFFIGIESYLIYFYSLSLIAGILLFKELNSHVVSSIVMIFFEVITLLESSIYDYVLTLGTHYGRALWYLTWILFSLLAVWSLDYLHRRFSLIRCISYRLIRTGFLLSIFINIIDCIDRYTFNSEITWFAILFAKSTIQIGFIVSLFIGLLTKQKSSSNIPLGAHNRAIKWYQSLRNLPPHEHALQLEEWRDYVSKLPTTTHIK
jgi:hypothetical protein